MLARQRRCRTAVIVTSSRTILPSCCALRNGRELKRTFALCRHLLGDLTDQLLGCVGAILDQDNFK
jgi:hypothetical protein